MGIYIRFAEDMMQKSSEICDKSFICLTMKKSDHELCVHIPKYIENVHICIHGNVDEDFIPERVCICEMCISILL